METDLQDDAWVSDRSYGAPEWIRWLSIGYRRGASNRYGFRGAFAIRYSEGLLQHLELRGHDQPSCCPGDVVYAEREFGRPAEDVSPCGVSSIALVWDGVAPSPFVRFFRELVA